VGVGDHGERAVRGEGVDQLDDGGRNAHRAAPLGDVTVDVRGDFGGLRRPAERVDEERGGDVADVELDVVDALLLEAGEHGVPVRPERVVGQRAAPAGEQRVCFRELLATVGRILGERAEEVEENGTGNR
jgi:hypothetical protein